MMMGGNRWLRFEIDQDSINGKQFVRHRLTCTSSFDTPLPKPCHLIEITSQIGRASKTVSVRDAAICAQDIPLGWRSYRGSTLLAVVQQTPDSEKETYVARHVPKVPLRGSCRLNPLLSDLEAWRYLASNIDVVEAVAGSPEGAREHYRDYGRYEGRSFAFEPLSYLASHPDLEVLAEDEIASCKHFINHGRHENRRISFSPRFYLDRNLDLQAAFGTDEREATLHYLRYGRGEGRATR